MGIAEGVGGWSRSNNNNNNRGHGPTPSALFAKRLMHNCAVELALTPLLSGSRLPFFTSNPNPNWNTWYWSDPWTPAPRSVHVSTPPMMEHGDELSDDEIPFLRRAMEAGRRFTGGKKVGWFSSGHSFAFRLFVSFRLLFVILFGDKNVGGFGYLRGFELFFPCSTLSFFS